MIERKPLLLMVEDEEDTALLNSRMLKRKGYEVLLAGSAAEARALARDNTPDLFVLDVALPDGDGFTLCDEIRKDSDTPVLFLTGRKRPEDRITGIRKGGDYYLTKPYNMDEFLTVTERLLQKAEQTQNKLDKAVREATELTRGPLTLILPQNKALVNGRDAELTPKEFAVLLMLVQNENKELSDETIYQSVWGMSMYNDKNAIRVHISRLKKKLGEEDTDDFSIVRLYGGGYSFITN
ncbi:MAG: response regulator transcription factor [Clostridiales bacterium]|jgi:DNA-binding response OmpR family regulator|nr:response regulator transcription factor [Clostridiales bacterium]